MILQRISQRAIATALATAACAAMMLTAGRAAAQSADALFGGPLNWRSTGPLIGPKDNATHDAIAVKDPTVVYYNNEWHVFATVPINGGTWSMQYTHFSDWDHAADAVPYYMDQTQGLTGYHCAPQVFYFEPQDKWYLIYQSQQPTFSTTSNLTDPTSWTRPQNFFATTPSGMPSLPIDYWVICDDSDAYLFFTGDNGNLYRSNTSIDQFPSGMSNPEVVIAETTSTLFEGSMTYKIEGMDKYLTLVEALGPSRYYRAYTADSLDGEWTAVPGADTYASPFAGVANVTYEDGVADWTNDVSHGELIRNGYDQTMTIDLNQLQMLYQGRSPSSGGDYYYLPYTLGLLTQVPTLIDFNGDGELDTDDYQILLTYHLQDLPGNSAAETYPYGDVDGDLDNDYQDFRLFKSEFMQTHGEAAFAQMSAAYRSVPEPGTIGMALLATITASLWRRAGDRQFNLARD